MAIGSDQALSALGGITGAADVRAGESTELVGLVAVDDRTLRVDLSEPDPYFLAKAGSPVAFVLKLENVEQWGVDWSDWFGNADVDGFVPTVSALPVGTGPFQLTTLEFLKRYELAPNPHYHGSVASIESVIFVVGSGTPEMDAFNADQVDIVRIDEPTLDEVADFTLTFHEWLVGAFQGQFEEISAQWSEQIGVATRPASSKTKH